MIVQICTGSNVTSQRQAQGRDYQQAVERHGKTKRARGASSSRVQAMCCSSVHDKEQLQAVFERHM